MCAISQCENDKKFSLINTTFPPKTSADKLFCIWKGKKRKQICESEKLTN